MPGTYHSFRVIEALRELQGNIEHLNGIENEDLNNAIYHCYRVIDDIKHINRVIEDKDQKIRDLNNAIQALANKHAATIAYVKAVTLDGQLCIANFE